MTGDELRALGEKSGRGGWQTYLARRLPKNPRTIRRWLSGKTSIDPALEPRIRQILRGKRGWDATRGIGHPQIFR